MASSTAGSEITLSATTVDLFLNGLMNDAVTNE
jgi:hypothetical protein